MENKITCKTEEEVHAIIDAILKENPNVDIELIKKAIASCCEEQIIVKKKGTFLDCVKERIRILKLMYNQK